jgi:hypothetical protein
MRYIIVSLVAVILNFPFFCHADFSGFSMVESPVDSIESIINQVLTTSNLEREMASQPKNFENLKEALIRGSIKDHYVLRSIVKVKNDLPGIKKLPAEERDREIAYSQEYLKSTAQEFGYNEVVLTGNP